jgi:hypothetical protein
MANGISLGIKSERQLQDERSAKKTEEEMTSMELMSPLANHISTSYEDARIHRETLGITDRLLKCRRLRRGKYSERELQQISETGGSQMFFNIVGPKCMSFVSWLEDVFSPQADTPWDIVPTPIPALPEEEARELIEEVIEEAQAKREETGAEIDPDELKRMAVEKWEDRLMQRRDDAKAKADNMRQLIDDQLTEGNFVEALSDFVDDLSVYPTAIMKGPVFKEVHRLEWQDGEMKKVTRVIPTWKAVDPFSFYPGTNVTNVNSGFVCEKFVMDKSSLFGMRGVTGWNANAIDSVLADGGRTTTTLGLNYGEVEHSYLEDRDPIKSEGVDRDSVEGVEFSGSVRGTLLRDWGMTTDAVPDENAYYEINAMLIGHHVVKAVLNPDPLNRRKYYVASFQKNRNSIWGLDGIPEQLEAIQQGVNGSQRSLMNNLAIASGPMVTVDIAALSPNQLPTVHKLHPWKVFPYDGKKTTTGTRKPIDFFQPQSNSNELVAVTEYYENKADDRTLIPKFVTGDANVGGAGRTASGLSMLMSAAARGIKRVVRNVDKDVMRPLLEAMYMWNMLHHEDKQVKGDAQIVPKGALAALVREQTQLRRQEFLQTTANDIDFQIVGIRGRAHLLREIAKGLDIDVDKIVPSDEEIEAQEQAVRENAAAAEAQALAEESAAADAAQQPRPQQ